MDRSVTGPVSHVRDSPGSQVTNGEARVQVHPCLARSDEQDMTQDELKRRASRKTFTIVVLVLVVLAIYIGSFFVVTG